MTARTFRGGVHPPEFKDLTCAKQVETLPPPERAVIPMIQNMGAPNEPTVGEGEEVSMGQIVGDTDAFVSAPVHASVSGVVEAVSTAVLPDGRKSTAVVIESDGREQVADSITPAADLEELSPEDIRDAVRSAGIVGMGGAAFPAHVKYAPPPDSEATTDTVIINGCECEPFLTCDHRVMLEQAEEVVFGLRVIMKACGAERGLIAVEDNKPDAIETLRRETEGEPYEVVPVQTKYPEGAEKQLIHAITEREVPSGGLPLHVGVVVNNVSTSAAIARALRAGMPCIERVVTVSGDVVSHPKNLRVRIGTPLRSLLEAAGGFSESPARLVAGGPMMGLAVYDLAMPVLKGTSGVTALSERLIPAPDEQPCIRCGRCVSVCPSFLMPLYLDEYPHESAMHYHPLDCIECGSCVYECPANRQILARIRLAKSEAAARQRQG